MDNDAGEPVANAVTPVCRGPKAASCRSGAWDGTGMRALTVALVDLATWHSKVTRFALASNPICIVADAVRRAPQVDCAQRQC